jgi:hypothetical protein
VGHRLRVRRRPGLSRPAEEADDFPSLGEEPGAWWSVRPGLSFVGAKDRSRPAREALRGRERVCKALPVHPSAVLDDVPKTRHAPRAPRPRPSDAGDCPGSRTRRPGRPPRTCASADRRARREAFRRSAGYAATAALTAAAASRAPDAARHARAACDGPRTRASPAQASAPRSPACRPTCGAERPCPKRARARAAPRAADWGQQPSLDELRFRNEVHIRPWNLPIRSPRFSPLYDFVPPLPATKES